MLGVYGVWRPSTMISWVSLSFLFLSSRMHIAKARNGINAWCIWSMASINNDLMGFFVISFSLLPNAGARAADMNVLLPELTVIVAFSSGHITC
ncbi:hypothetical protein ASPBRDRAFT_311688 [Aspergillus brasiliensis CBS 101740]|uniref:Uncharacterized protein n=1 Tax=Aspergillus brasiliensis (strain CBS 101740 / IMI 381727 / IBT 21946) TaxID=767769 RepID=A0A1L9UAL3_ASPBC|nr:hypothetical protein ASPBRDRAFT_311688 [Aspergillus brasiliensis CBS 101740]